MGFCRFQTPKDNKSAPTDDILWLMMSDVRIIIQEVGEEEDLSPCSPSSRLPQTPFSEITKAHALKKDKKKK